jgi:hypothetical protein
MLWRKPCDKIMCQCESTGAGPHRRLTALACGGIQNKFSQSYPFLQANPVKICYDSHEQVSTDDYNRERLVEQVSLKT